MIYKERLGHAAWRYCFDGYSTVASAAKLFNVSKTDILTLVQKWTEEQENYE